MRLGGPQTSWRVSLFVKRNAVKQPGSLSKSRTLLLKELEEEMRRSFAQGGLFRQLVATRLEFLISTSNA